MTRTPRSRLSRTERLNLIAAILRGVASGTIGAIVTWLLDHLDQFPQF